MINWVEKTVKTGTFYTFYWLKCPEDFVCLLSCFSKFAPWKIRSAHNNSCSYERSHRNDIFPRSQPAFECWPPFGIQLSIAKNIVFHLFFFFFVLKEQKMWKEEKWIAGHNKKDFEQLSATFTSVPGVFISDLHLRHFHRPL